MEIQNLLSYYLECVSKDIDMCITEYQLSSEKVYQTIYSIPESLLKLKEDESVKSFLEYAKKVNPNKMLCIGYPMYIKEKISSNNKKYNVVEPLFIIPIDSTKVEIDKVKINKNFVESMLKSKNSLEVLNAIMDIYREIDYFNENVEYLKCIENIYSKKDEYPFIEKIDAKNISTQDIKKITKEGIYNNAALFITGKSKYTEGLERELVELKSLCKIKTESILDILVNSNGYIDNNFKENNVKFLEVLDTNTEQKQAIKKALTSKISVIKGPPGTGKSQVVTNLIINAIYNNKTVLFSSKNHKAVDVVCDRINKVSKYPIIMNIKSSQDIKNYMIPYVDSLINANFKVDLNYYNAIEYALKNKKNKLEKTDLEIQEQQEMADMIKEKRENTYHIRQNIIDIETFKKNLNILEEIKLYEIDKILNINKKGIINKIKFNFNKKNTIYKLKEEINYINEKLRLCSIKEMLKLNNTENLNEVINEIEKFKEKLNEYNLLADYFKSLAGFNKKRNIVDIIKKSHRLKQEYIAMSKEVCNKFLEKKSLDLTYLDKQNLISYKNMLNAIARDSNVLLNKTFLTNYNDINYRINKILPAMAITSLSIKGKYPLNPASIDLVIIDEATQCDIASVIPLLYRAKSICVIGDDKQLEHITNITDTENVELLSKYNIYSNLAWDYKNNSIYSLIESYIKEDEKILLKEHHRSHKDIIDFSNKYYYENKLKVATKYSNLNFFDNEIIKIINVEGKTSKKNGVSAFNIDEIKKVKEVLLELLNKKYSGTIGVITPFKAQAEYINKEIQNDPVLKKLFETNELLIDTVNRFQGDEKDVIIFSLCMSDGVSNGAINFLKNTEKLFNVAITRAKSNLYLICNKKYIKENLNINYLKDFLLYKEKLDLKKQEEEKYKNIFENTNGIYPKFSNIPYSNMEKELYEKLYENNIKAKIKYPLDGYYIDLLLDGNIAIIFERENNKEEIILINKLLEEGYIVKKIYDFQVEDSMEYIIKEVT